MARTAIRYNTPRFKTQTLGRRRNVGNPGQFPTTFGKLGLLGRSRSVVRIRLAISQAGQDEELQCLGPVSGPLDVCGERDRSMTRPGRRRNTSKLTLKRLLLELKLFLSRTSRWHVTSIHGHPRPLSRRRTIIMRRPRIPNDEISRPSLDFDPFETLALEPLDAGLGEPVPLVGPLPNPSLLGKLLVKLFAQEMSSLGHDQSAVIGTVG